MPCCRDVRVAKTRRPPAVGSVERQRHVPSRPVRHMQGSWAVAVRKLSEPQRSTNDRSYKIISEAQEEKRKRTITFMLLRLHLRPG